ncbi:hypothetical protein EMCRGX_G018278 [Ephydatia muelleri]
MTTRSGRAYTSGTIERQADTDMEQGLAGLTDLLRAMLEERKQKEEEEARRREQERRDREEESRRAEAQKELERQEREEEKRRAEAQKEQERREREEENRRAAEERKRREEEEAARREQERREREEEKRRAEAQRDFERQERDKELRMQMELLVKLVEAKKTESPEPTRTGENELRGVKLTDRDDIEAYLTTFERLMAAYSIPRAKWIFKLAPQLTGKAQQAYAALTTEDALSYDAVKAAILRRYEYDITEETYRQRFRAAVQSHEESHRDLSIRLDDLANKWLRGVNTVELEQKPKTALEAGQLADDYKEARRQSTKDDQVISVPAPGTKTSSQPSKEDGGPSHSRDKRLFRPGHWRGDYLSTVTCYKCGKQGHVASRVGLVEGREVKDIVLDTGRSKTIVHHSLVPEKKLVTGEAVTIRCAHGDSVLYPLANVDLVIDGVPLTVEAAVSKSLPVSVLLGTDVPELAKFVGGKARGARRQGNEAWMVVTRAGARRQEEEEKTLK